MDRRFAERYEELMADAEVKPEALEGVLERLKEFVRPFAASLEHAAQREHLEEYVAGLVSNIKRKNIESIAYLHEQDRQPLQKFIGQKPWDWQPMISELARQIGSELGEADGVLVFDPSGVLKQGKASVGVGRQWCGRAGKVDNCQVGVYMGYVTRKEHALVDTRLYLPEEWTKDKKRCKRAGIPKEIRFRTRHKLALEMLREHRAALPHRWVTGDDEMGRNSHFREELREMDEQYLLAVPSNTLVRDLDATPPPSQGSGQPRKVPFQRADNWMKAAKNWTRIEVRPGEKGPLVVEMTKARVQAKLGRRNGPEETAGGLSRAARRRHVQARLLSVQRSVQHAAAKNSRECWARSIASKNVSGGPKAKRAWRSTRFARGRVGITIRRSLCLRLGS